MSAALDTVVETLRGCVLAALAATDAGAPARVCEVAGQLAWDNCDCGVLAVTVDRMYPSTMFPQQAPPVQLAAACPPPYEAVDLAVTVLRCAPGPDGQGRSPSCTQLDAASLTWFLDVDAVRQALACCLVGLRDADTVVDFVLRDTVPLGPEGGCVGSETRLAVGLANCPCPVG
jgi:hypothetical protein